MQKVIPEIVGVQRERQVWFGGKRPDRFICDNGKAGFERSGHQDVKGATRLSISNDSNTKT